MASAVIGGFWLWHLYDDLHTARLAKKYKPFPLPQQPTFSTSNVSIIIPTVDTPEVFTDCLRLWLSNNPKEIIIITIERDLDHVYNLVKPIIDEGEDRISLMTAGRANKRDQLIVGIKEATGKILALVDDDAFWTSETLPYLLAGFEDPKVGATVGKQSAHIPEERRDPKVITPWEVASLRALDNQNNVQAVRFAADKSCFCLVGRTFLMRAEIAQDPKFTHAVTNQHWRGQRLNTGDDVFVTRWLQTLGWDICVQNAPEAEITTLVMRDSDLLRQMVRWQRSAVQSFICTIVDEPGIFKLWKKHPYMARKLVERLLRPILSWAHIFALIQGLRSNSFVAYFAIFWYAWGMMRTYKAFTRRFPWVAGNTWAAVLLDNCYPVLDVYTWATLSTETWGTRNEDA